MVVVMTTDPPTAKDIFVELVTNVAPDQWDQRLDEACQGDDVLRQRVRALLRAHAEPGSFLEQPAVGDATMIQEPLISERPGTVIGPYKLLEQIGEGGMGVVFMAEQTEPIQRTVALKIIKPGMDTRQVIARFEAERQALAMMDHPNIARVLDAGTTGGGSRDEGPGPRASNGASLALDHRPSTLDHSPGRPYFVMDLVKGVPITDYCDRQHLSVRERLELFAQVCQAVQHAHQKGIIHRDLKPSNVLVAEYDGKPVPKIIDFGVAKATAQRLTERTMFTEYGQLIGTFEYMSPEQARFNQLDVDTRSDIYSLGVLLYELLAGSTPLEKERLRSAAFDEILRIIADEDPPLPSTRLSSSQLLPSIAANRNLEPRRLTGLISGELDWIVMKCLEKNRNRRYETASAFAEDLQHYLRDEPVQACPPSASYRFRKFAKRNKVALFTSAILAGMLAACAVISTWQAVRATRAEAVANSQRNQALREKARADEAAVIAAAINNFYGVEILGQASPERNARHGFRNDPKLTVRAALDRAANRIGKWIWKTNPMVEAAVCRRVSDIYTELGAYDKAIEFGERSLSILRQSRGISNAGTLECMMNLANAYTEADRNEKAEALYLEALPVAHRVLGDYDPTTRLLHQNLAWLYCSKMGRDEEAEQHLARSFDRGTTKPHIYQVSILVEIHLHRKEYDKAEALLRETLQDVVKESGDQSMFAMWVREDLARTYVGQRRFAEAEALFLTVLAGYRKLFDGADPRYSLRVTASLAALYDAWGKPDQAAEWRAKLPTTAPTTAPASAPAVHSPEAEKRASTTPTSELRALDLNKRAWSMATSADPQTRDPHTAVELAQEAVKLAPKTADFWNTLGVARYRAGDFKDAISSLQKYRDLRTSDAEYGNPLFLAMAHWQLGDKEEARQWFDKGAQWMDAHNTNSDTMVRFRKEAAELLGVNESQSSSDPPLQEK